MNETFVWDLSRQFIELLMTSLLITGAFLFAVMLILIFCLCREEMRAGRKNAGTKERVSSEAGAQVKTLTVEHPKWDVEPALFSPEPKVAA